GHAAHDRLAAGAADDRARARRARRRQDVAVHGARRGMTTVAETQAPPPAAGAIPRPPASIVPLAGLPFVGIAIGLLVGSIASDWTWGLNFCHVAGGGAWTAIDLFVGL